MNRLRCIAALSICVSFGSASVAGADVGSGLEASAREEPSLRTARSATYVQRDGTMVTQIAETAVNFRGADGKWLPIDTDLAADGGEISNESGPVDVELPTVFGGDPVRVNSCGGVGLLRS